jgi:hypothetical protein
MVAAAAVAAAVAAGAAAGQHGVVEDDMRSKLLKWLQRYPPPVTGVAEVRGPFRLLSKQDLLS